MRSSVLKEVEKLLKKEKNYKLSLINFLEKLPTFLNKYDLQEIDMYIIDESEDYIRIEDFETCEHLILTNNRESNIFIIAYYDDNNN